jgi:hypothetical protein
MVARNTNVPFKGRIQKRKTYHLQIITFRLQRAAGPYRSANNGLVHLSKPRAELAYSITSSARARKAAGTVNPSALAVFILMTSWKRVGCSTGKSAG